MTRFTEAKRDRAAPVPADAIPTGGHENVTESGRYDDTWVRRFHVATPGAARLICFPHAGGSASFFHPVSASLSPRIEVLAVQYPGRQDRRQEPLVSDIGELADLVVSALGPLDAWPTVYFGHSFGAVLAYEVALRQRVAGAGPDALIASGRRAPSRYRDEDIHLRDDAGVVTEIKELSGTDAALLGDEEILRMILPAIRADYTAIETYRSVPGARLHCPISAFVGTSDPRTSRNEAEAWGDHTTGRFSLRTFPGGHFYLAAQQHAVNTEISRTVRELSTAGDSVTGPN